MIPSWPRPLVALAMITGLVAFACSETPTFPPTPAPPSAAFAIAQMTQCGASFRVIASEEDSLMAPYGIPNTVYTTDVCESWTGSDYTFQATAVGSSENLPGFTDSVQSVIYQSGSVTGYSQNGAAASPPSAVGSNAFDFLYADSSTRQASYDDPYYGMSSPDSAACLDPPCPYAPTESDSKFVKHGFSRRGVRALVDAAEEIAPSKEGYRRFREVNDSTTIIRSIDPKTQLLMFEEVTGPLQTIRVTHTWTRVTGGYVREHSDLSTVEQIGGKQIRGSGRLVFQNVRITDPTFPSLSGPDVAK